MCLLLQSNYSCLGGEEKLQLIFYWLGLWIGALQKWMLLNLYTMLYQYEFCMCYIFCRHK